MSIGGPLISVEELAHALAADDGPVVLDIRHRLAAAQAARPSALPAQADYAAGHIPGAVFVDLERELAGPPGRGGRHPLPDADMFAHVMRAKGVYKSRPVVVYDDGGALSAARAWWLLRHHGHPNVAVLDGGLSAWLAAGQALATEVPACTPGDFDATPGGMPLLDADGAARLARTGVLLDARAAERFRGEFEPVDPIAGHIPGARSHPATQNLDDHGRFRPAKELRAALNISPGAAVGAYCGSGVIAAQLVLALEIADHRAALYAGSWSDWISDPSRPVATAATDSL
jgi:thiosulfate/3-mercaptopyruvate sulfurtransferase